MARPGTFKKGHPRVGGRKKGIPPKKSPEFAVFKRMEAAKAEMEAAKQSFQAAMAGEMAFTPLQVMHAVMLLRIARDDFSGALEAARDAAPYVHAKLNAAEVKVQHSIGSKSDAEVAADIAALRAKLDAARLLPTPPVTIEAAAEPVEAPTSG